MIIKKYAIPVAWAISNREDKIVLKYILESIKLKYGSFTSSWFMSDMAPRYFNAWKEDFDNEQHKIFVVCMAY